jgi:shikimate kinase
MLDSPLEEHPVRLKNIKKLTPKATTNLRSRFINQIIRQRISKVKGVEVHIWSEFPELRGLKNDRPLFLNLNANVFSLKKFVNSIKATFTT